MHGTAIGNNSLEKVKSIVERVEHLNEQIEGLSEDRNGIFQEAKSGGFDVKALKTILRMRKMDPAKRREEQAVLESYMIALGMV